MFIALVVGAALIYSVGGYFMKLSRGLADGPATAMVFLCFCLGAALQTVAMRDEGMTVTYVIVLGLEAVAAYLLGTVLLHESTSAAKAGGIALIVVGIALLKLKT
jgi:small multidrug resistance pump/quaternary ammonium compound-resistance protein SugE